MVTQVTAIRYKAQDNGSRILVYRQWFDSILMLVYSEGSIPLAAAQFLVLSFGFETAIGRSMPERKPTIQRRWG